VDKSETASMEEMGYTKQLDKELTGLGFSSPSEKAVSFGDVKRDSEDSFLDMGKA
jgi:hypothetical protein